jgi:hypothetical protein
MLLLLTLKWQDFWSRYEIGTGAGTRTVINSSCGSSTLFWAVKFDLTSISVTAGLYKGQHWGAG